MSGYLTKLGIYGMDNIEIPILAGLVTGMPVLLVGAHGTAKTLLTRRIAKTMDLRYQEYDASKSLFEDVIGFPNPKSLSQGQVDYVSTPISIWGKEFLFIDELSRASAIMQNKWLELIRSRQVMGKKVDTLKYVFAAMNPPGYLGSTALDTALAGRFAFIIEVPKLADMNTANKLKIMTEFGDDDIYGISSLRSEENKSATKTISGIVSLAREVYDRVSNKYGEQTKSYLLAIESVMQTQNKEIDGRRLSMIYSNVISYTAVVIADKMLGSESTIACIELPDSEIEDIQYKTLEHSFPDIALGDPISNSMLKYIHDSAVRICSGKDKTFCSRFKVLTAKKVGDMAKEYISNIEMFNETDHQDFVSRLEEMYVKNKNSELLIETVDAVTSIVNALDNPNVSAKIPVDVQRRILRYFTKISGLSEPAYNNILCLINWNHQDNVSLTEFDLNNFAMCLSMFVSLGNYYRSNSSIDFYRLNEELLNLAVVYNALYSCTLKLFNNHIIADNIS